MKLLLLFLLPALFVSAEDPATIDHWDSAFLTPDPISCTFETGPSICINGGSCILEGPNAGHCQCTSHWVTYPRNAAQAARTGREIPTLQGCTFPRKSRLLAFLLEFFIALGSGYGAIGQWGLFAGQFVLGLISFTAVCPCFGMLCKDKDGCLSICYIVYLIFNLLISLGTLAWFVIALVQIGGGYINAGDGSPISDW